MMMRTRIRRLRIARNLSQRELATRAKLSLSMVSKLERGERSSNLRLRAARNIASALRCSPGWLLFGSGEPPDVLAA